MIELIGGEIDTLFPTKMVDFNREFLIHCSEVFRNTFVKQFMKAGYFITVPEENRILGATKFQIPAIGILTFVIDMEQGYKIEKIN